MSLQVPDEAVALILEFEGVDQPSEWPGESSGITIGAGYDLGYTPADQFEEDWSPFLSADEIERLKDVIDLKGEDARRRAGEFRDIRIRTADAEEVFKQRTLPKYSKETEDAFPGVDELPPKVQGALVSLVFNRGAGMDGDRRREMRAIHDAIINSQGSGEGEDPQVRQNNLLRFIATQLRAMKRLWGQNMRGLLRRRDAEADLVESAID